MLIREINRKLDRRVVLSYKGRSNFFSIFEKHKQVAPAYGYVDGGRAILSVFVRKGDSSLPPPALDQFNPVTKDEYSIIRFESDQDAVPVEHLNRLYEIPSLIGNILYVEGGCVRLEMRFHHSSAKIVSEVLRDLAKEDEYVSVQELGSSPGIVETLNSINSRFPLMLVGYEGYAPKNAITRQAGPDRVTEASLSFTTSEGFKIVSYSPSPLGESVTAGVISREDGIVETRASVPFISEIWKKSSERRIPRYAAFGRIRGEKFEGYSIVSRILAEEQMRVILEVSDKSPDSGFFLTHFQPYTPEIWDWL